MIKLTDSAADKMKKILAESDSTGIRVSVLGGGCSGLQYKLEASKDILKDDKVIIEKEVELYVDKKSSLFLVGTTIDFVKDIMQMGFKFINPNAKRTCGCGESFGA